MWKFIQISLAFAIVYHAHQTHWADENPNAVGILIGLVWILVATLWHWGWHFYNRLPLPPPGPSFHANLRRRG